MSTLYWKILGPIKWRWHELMLLAWCARTMSKYKRLTGDSVHGDSTSRLVGLNYLRAVLDLYSAVQGKGAQDTRFSINDVLHVLNMNKKYAKHHEGTKQEFDTLIFRWQARNG